jgi:hypothetical protein
MLTKGWKTATVKYRIAVLSAIFATGILEFDLELKNPFSSLTIPDLGMDAKVVQPFDEDELQTIAAKCLDDGEAGLIAGLQTESGLRVSEAAFLQIADVHLDAPIPFIDIVANVKRRLKNAASARKIPLLGISLLAGRSAVVKAGTGSVWLFPELVSRGSNVASKTVNLWLKETIGGNPFRPRLECFSLSSRHRGDSVGTPDLWAYRGGLVGLIRLSIALRRFFRRRILSPYQLQCIIEHCLSGSLTWSLLVILMLSLIVMLGSLIASLLESVVTLIGWSPSMIGLILLPWSLLGSSFGSLGLALMCCLGLLAVARIW